MEQSTETITIPNSMMDKLPKPYKRTQWTMEEDKKLMEELRAGTPMHEICVMVGKDEEDMQHRVLHAAMILIHEKNQDFDKVCTLFRIPKPVMEEYHELAKKQMEQYMEQKRQTTDKTVHGDHFHKSIPNLQRQFQSMFKK